MGRGQAGELGILMYWWASWCGANVLWVLIFRPQWLKTQLSDYGGRFMHTAIFFKTVILLTSLTPSPVLAWLCSSQSSGCTCDPINIIDP